MFSPLFHCTHACFPVLPWVLFTAATHAYLRAYVSSGGHRVRAGNERGVRCKHAHHNGGGVQAGHQERVGRRRGRDIHKYAILCSRLLQGTCARVHDVSAGARCNNRRVLQAFTKRVKDAACLACVVLPCSCILGWASTHALYGGVVASSGHRATYHPYYKHAVLFGICVHGRVLPTADRIVENPGVLSERARGR